MMDTKCNHSKGDMKVEAKSLSSGSRGKFIEVVIMLILIGSYYSFIHGYYCSTTVNTARTKLKLLHRILRTVLMVDSITFGQEMVNILLSGKEYDKVFNHLDMLHAPLKGKGFITTASHYYYCYVVAWHGDLKLRAISLQRKLVSFMEIYDLNFTTEGEVCARTLFVLSSSNRGRLLGFIDLIRQMNKRMKQERLIRHYGILQKMEDSTRYVKERNKINIEDLLEKDKDYDLKRFSFLILL
ncbi:hypothetical protein Tco_0583787 [Tanacetum coccineum]